MASDSSSEPNQGPISFFKVVRYPSAAHLCLPNAFVRTYLEKIPKNAIIKSAAGEHSWRLTFKKSGKDYCFANGWDELVKDAQLCIMDVVVFTLTDPSTFHVSFYDSHGCEKDLPSSNTSCDDEVTPTPDEDLCFQKRMMDQDFSGGDDDVTPTPVEDLCFQKRTMDQDFSGGNDEVTRTPDEDLCFQKRTMDQDFSGGNDEVTRTPDEDLCFQKRTTDQDLSGGDDEVTPTPDEDLCFQRRKMDQDFSGGDDEVTPILDEDLFFHKRISMRSNKYAMVLPKKFVMAAGLEKKTRIRMKDVEGKEWILGLAIEKYETTKYSLSAGWSFFRQHNDLSHGDICLFKFLKEEGVLILSQVVKSKFPRNQETPTVVEEGKRKRGRPPVLKSPPPPPPPPAAADVKIKIEDESCPSLEKPCGFAQVKIEEESGAEEMAVKTKRGRPPLEKPAGGSGGFLEVKTEVQTDLVKRKRGRPRIYKTGSEAERLFRNKQVIYF